MAFHETPSSTSRESPRALGWLVLSTRSSNAETAGPRSLRWLVPLPSGGLIASGCRGSRTEALPRACPPFHHAVRGSRGVSNGPPTSPARRGIVAIGSRHEGGNGVRRIGHDNLTPSTIADGIRRVFEEAWNRHDMDAFAELFRDGASFVNVRGMRMDGRAAIRDHHAAIHAGFYRDSVVRLSVEDAQQLSPEVMVCHIRTELDGDERTPGVTRATTLTLVLALANHQWRIAAAQNTEIA